MTKWKHFTDYVNNYFKAVTSTCDELIRRLLNFLKFLMYKHFRSCHVNKHSARYFLVTDLMCNEAVWRYSPLLSATIMECGNYAAHSIG
jgi:hypothetical protein